MDKLYQLMYRPLIWIVVLTFIVVYPMLISIYVFLPLFIGIMGYLFILGIERKLHYVLMSLLYFINLEANLSLPFFLTIIASLLVYLFTITWLIFENVRYVNLY